MAMQLAEDHATAEFIIHSCSAGWIRVNNQNLAKSFMLLPGQQVRSWPVTVDEPLRSEHFAPVLEHKPELVILGTGVDLRLPDPEVYGTLLSQDIGLEAMTTVAACRTYNLLAQDGRDIVACLILPA